MTDADADLRQFAHQLFAPDTPDEPDDPAPPANLHVPNEGSSPPATISDAARNADYVKRLFDDEYDTVQQPLPE